MPPASVIVYMDDNNRTLGCPSHNSNNCPSSTYGATQPSKHPIPPREEINQVLGFRRVYEDVWDPHHDLEMNIKVFHDLLLQDQEREITNLHTRYKLQKKIHM